MAIYNVAILNGKKFDISHVCDRFNKNPELTLEDIASEFAISRDELVKRLKEGAGKDEKTRVDGIIREDKQRQKRRNADAKQKNEDKKDTSRVEKEKTVTTTNYDEQRKSLAEEIAQSEQKLAKSIEQYEKLESLAEKSQKQSLAVTELIEKLESEIELLQKRLEDARQELKSIKEVQQNAHQKYEQDVAALDAARVVVKTNQENLEILKMQLEDLENRMIYLVAPTYDLSKLPTSGRCISSVELEGVDLEQVQSNANSLGMLETANLMQLTSLTIEELIVAYDYAWLVWAYLCNQDYEVHVLNEDDRIQKLIDYLAA